MGSVGWLPDAASHLRHRECRFGITEGLQLFPCGWSSDYGGEGSHAGGREGRIL